MTLGKLFPLSLVSATAAAETASRSSASTEISSLASLPFGLGLVDDNCIAVKLSTVKHFDGFTRAFLCFHFHESESLGLLRIIIFDNVYCSYCSSGSKIFL